MTRSLTLPLRRTGPVLGLLVLLAVLRLPGVFSRGIWYDETITLLVTAGHPGPIWPRSPTPAYVAKAQLEGAPSLPRMWNQLRRTDVHPPLYFWILRLWRGWLGSSLEVARVFSLCCSMGGLLVFYLLLKAGGMVRPAVPTLVFGLATFSVHMGHEARGYAQALLFVLLAALLALLSAEVSLRGARCRTALAVATGLSCGAALWTNYLSLFPVIAILLWSFLGLRRHRSHRLAVLPIIVMALVSLPLLGLLPMQLGARPLQEAGRPWWHDQTLLLAWMNLSDYHTLMFSCHPLQYAVWGLVSILVLVSFVLILRRWQHEDSRFHLLMLGLALSPSLGIVLLNLIFDKHLSTLRYVGLGLPGLSVLVSYWPNTLLDSKRKVGAGILALLLLAQFTGVNLGLERTPGQGDTRIRSTVEAIESLASPLSQVVVIGAGSGRGYPGSVIHELSPETMMAVLYGWGFSDVDALGRQVATFEQVCMMYSLEIASWDAERAFVAFLTTNGGYEEAFRIGTATCFHRTTPVESPGE